MPQSTIARATLALVAGTLLALAGFMAWQQLRPAQQGIVSMQGTVSGTALVGGPFELTDQHGATRRDSEFRGQYMLVYFGYSNCPDVCPIALSAMSDALDRLTADGSGLEPQITPIFITVDPARDTVAFLENYVANFHPRLVALTGARENLEEAAKAYRVYHKKAAAQEMAGMENDGIELIDHSSLIFLMDPAGAYLAHFTHDSDGDTIAAKLREMVKGS